MLKKAGSHVEKLFRKSHTSRQATEGALNASATAAASGTTESKENSAPATRNVIELVKKLDEVIAGLGTSGPSLCFYCDVILRTLGDFFADGEFPVDQTFVESLLDQAEKLPQYTLPRNGPDWRW